VKVATAALALARYADALERAEAFAAAARLRAFAEALQPVRSESISRFADVCSRLSLPHSSDPERLGELAPLIEALVQLLEEVGKPEIVGDLRRLLAVIRERGDISIGGFATAVRKHVASASKGQPRKGAAPMDRSLVDGYLKRLEAALGDDAAFRDLFREIDGDKRVTRVEAVELASRFLGPTPPATSRPKALQRLLHRHQKLMDFKRSSESIRRGRPAA